MNDIRETAINLIRKLPAEVDWDDIIEELYFKAKIDNALKEVREGKSISHQEVKARLGLN